MPTRIEDFTIGWICAIPTEYTAACELLDHVYATQDAPRVQGPSIYTFGRIHEHNIAITCLPYGRYGLTSAAITAERMRASFPALQFGLMVGIGGGAPSQKHDIRLGDVVVSSPTPGQGGVIQYDYGKAIQGHEFEETGHLASPPEVFLNGLSKIKALHNRKRHQIEKKLDEWLKRKPDLRMEYDRPDSQLDILYKASFVHSEQQPCACQKNEQPSVEKNCESLVVTREVRESGNHGVRIHYGLIASANTLMKDATARDALVKKYDVLCFEMEAAGLMNILPCLIIRGVCDYSDSHKNDRWHGYAAAVAAIYAKELLAVIPGQQIGSSTSTANISQPGLNQSQHTRLICNKCITILEESSEFHWHTKSHQVLCSLCWGSLAEEKQVGSICIILGSQDLTETAYCSIDGRAHRRCFTGFKQNDDIDNRGCWKSKPLVICLDCANRPRGRSKLQTAAKSWVFNGREASLKAILNSN